MRSSKIKKSADHTFIESDIDFGIYLMVGEPEIQKLEKSGRKVAEF